MKCSAPIDPAQCTCGPATAAVRQLLTEWIAIDWLGPPRPNSAPEAIRSLEHHQRLAHAQQPELFDQQITITLQTGGWPELSELCERVRMQRWDWKYAALKQLSHRHSEAHAWRLSDEIDHAGEPLESSPWRLFLRMGTIVIWNELGPKLDFEHLDEAHASDALWYLSYARMDLIECIEWQLAERSDQLDGNPFLPLVRCYALGFYPFSLTRSQLVLFSFGTPS